MTRPLIASTHPMLQSYVHPTTVLTSHLTMLSQSIIRKPPSEYLPPSVRPVRATSKKPTGKLVGGLKKRVDQFQSGNDTSMTTGDINIHTIVSFSPPCCLGGN